MRLLNFVVIGALILAASYVYSLKFDSTLQAEQVEMLQRELHQERNAIAALRAEWAKLASPARLEALARRHLPLAPVKPQQFGDFESLPKRAPRGDPIGAMLDPAGDAPTGSVPAPSRTR